MSNVRKPTPGADTRCAAARWRASSVRTPVVSAIDAAESQVASSSSMIEMACRSSANAARAAARSRPARRRARLRRTSTTACRAVRSAPSARSNASARAESGSSTYRLSRRSNRRTCSFATILGQHVKHSPRSLRPARRTKRRTRSGRDPTGADPVLDTRATRHRTEHRLRSPAVGDPQDLSPFRPVEVLGQPLFQLPDPDISHVGTLPQRCVHIGRERLPVRHPQCSWAGQPCRIAQAVTKLPQPGPWPSPRRPRRTGRRRRQCA